MEIDKDELGAKIDLSNRDLLGGVVRGAVEGITLVAVSS